MECGPSSVDVRIDVKYYYDSESRNWGFVIPSLHVVGGADTREQAEQSALEAIAFALEPVEETATEADEELGHVWVTVHR